MSIIVQCPGCGGKFRAPDEAAGKRVKCTKCSATIEVGSTHQPQSEQTSAAGGGESPIPLAIPIKPTVPTKKAEGRSGVLSWAWLGGGAIILLLVIGLAWLFISHKPPPEESPTAVAQVSAPMPPVLTENRNPKQLTTTTDQETQQRDQIATSAERNHSESKGPAASMYYTIEESGGQFTIVIHNSPLGRYEFPVPNLNGIYVRASNDKKHYISVLAWQGNIESVTWNRNNVPPNKEEAEKVSEETKATRIPSQPDSGPISIARDNERLVFKYNVGELEGLKPGEWAALIVFLARVGGPVLDERIIKAKDSRSGIAGQGAAFAYGSVRGSVMFAHIAAHGSPDLAGYRLSIYDTEARIIRKGAVVAIPFSALDSLKDPDVFGRISATPSLDWEWLGHEVLLSAGLVAFKTENGNFEFQRFLGPIATHRVKRSH